MKNLINAAILLPVVTFIIGYIGLFGINFEHNILNSHGTISKEPDCFVYCCCSNTQANTYCDKWEQCSAFQVDAHD